MRSAILIALAISVMLAGAPITLVEGGGYFPVLVGLKDGTLLTVFRGGAPHIGRGGRLDLSSSSDQGKTWSARRTVVDGPDDDRNPALGQLKDGTVVLAYSVLSGYEADGLKLPVRHFDGVFTMTSRDAGKTWSKAARSEAARRLHPDASLSPYGKIVQLPDGAALMAVYYTVAGRFESRLFRSTDGGRTWSDPSLIRMDGNETALAVLPDGTVLAAVRTTEKGYLSVTRSIDKGRTWSEPVQVTKDAEHPADLLVLRDGRVLMAYGERREKRGVRALLSSDGGKTWGPEQPIVLADDAPNTDCGYPSSWEIAPGRIVTVYYQVDDKTNAPASAKAKALPWTVPARGR